jgi:phosphate starvation-inducible PhoH-like protein
LREAEPQLGVKLLARDGWLKIDGPASRVAQAKEFFEQLAQAAQKGIRIRRHEFRYILQAILEGKSAGLEGLWNLRIPVSPKKPPLNPKTFGQRLYLQTIEENDLTLGIGPAGTGKTYLAVAMAVAALRGDRVKKIVLTRPAVEAGEALGYLPGDLQEKVLPYLRPLYDALEDMLDREEIQRYTERGVIEIAPLAYMRGRTLAQSFIILDEGQNTTTEQMLMFLTRLGPESKCVVTGDPTQVDLPHHRKSGLSEAVQALEGVPGIGLIKFDESDIIRHELVGKIVAAYQRHRGVRQTSMAL